MALDRTMKESLYTFLGVNLKRDTLAMDDGDLARAINYDLHTRPGVLLLRKGSSLLSATQLADAVRQVARHNGHVYAVAGSRLYRDFTSILTTLSAGNYLSLNTMRPFNDGKLWTFIASNNPNIHQKDDGTAVVGWGIAAPETRPVLAAGAAGQLRGSYNAVYTYIREDGSSVAHESNPSSAASSNVTLTDEKLNIDVTASLDSQVTSIRVYRTVSGGTLYLFDQTVDNTTATIVSSHEDTELGAAVETDNDLPPNVGVVTEYQNHFFGVQDLAHPDYLWFAKRFRPESWPTDQFLRMGTTDDPLNGLVRMSGFLGVFSGRSKYRVSGNSVSGFAWAEALNTRGTVAPHALLATSLGVIFWAKDGLWVTNFLQADQELGPVINPVFESGVYNDYAAVDWSRAREFSLSEYKRRFYASYMDVNGEHLIAVYSQDTGRWYHYRQQCRSLYYDETTDQLLMGNTFGFVFVLEVGTTDDGIAVTGDAWTRSMVGVDRFTRKQFKFVKLDAEAVGAGGTITFLVDGAPVRVIPVTAATRTALRVPLRLPDTMGYSWAVRVAGQVQLYGAVVLLAPLEDV